jgi:hypothetical protein
MRPAAGRREAHSHETINKGKNGFDQCVARQQLCKHGPTRSNSGNCVLYRADRPANRLAG